MEKTEPSASWDLPWRAQPYRPDYIGRKTQRTSNRPEPMASDIQILFHESDSYDGPVMVKTDRNFGGMPEEALRNRSLSFFGRARRKIRSLGSASEFRWDEATVLDIRAYPTFDSLREVPEGGGDNPRESGQPVPPEVLAVREKLRMDYGKIDYVIHEGQPIIFDVNRTPGAGPPDGSLRRTKPFAPGVIPLLQRQPGEYQMLESVDVDSAAEDSS